MPEFFIDRLYDENHRYDALSNIEGERIRLLQKGLRKKLRQMLVAGNPGEFWEYDCTITGSLHEGKAFPELISPPAWDKVNGHRMYRVAIGEFVFAFVVSSHKPDFILDRFLQWDGQLLILRKEFTQIPFLMDIASQVAAGTKGKQLPGTQE